MSRSRKTPVIKWLFEQRFDATTGELSDPVVTFDDIREGIHATQAPLSTSNPANFWKDLVRKPGSLLRAWPPEVLDAGYYGTDAIGDADQASFKFVPADEVDLYADTVTFDPDNVPVASVQSLSMPLAMKALGRQDENWLAQVTARLAVIETHFALFSPRAVDEVDFLQTGVKLGRGEVDVAYSVHEQGGSTWLVAIEAKGRGEMVHLPQLLRASKAMLASYGKKVEAAGVIPFAIKIVGDSLIHTMEFEPITGPEDALELSCQAAIQLEPPVPGVR